MPRHVFGGDKLAHDAARLLEQDRATPPESRPSLMDVVRTFSEYIETRARLGWTDPMIAALLTDAGYPITAATLRSYRKRLRDASGAAVRPKGTDPPKTAEPAVVERQAKAEPIGRASARLPSPPPTTAGERLTRAPTASPPSIDREPTPAMPARSQRPSTTFWIKDANKPPDRA